jgi:hypothetical protein
MQVAHLRQIIATPQCAYNFRPTQNRFWGSPISGASAKLQRQMVRMKGLEPSRELPHSDLNAARLPIPPHPHVLIWSGGI